MEITWWTRFTCALPAIPWQSDMYSLMRLYRLCVNASTKAVLITFLLSLSHYTMCQRSAWIATWATSPEPADADPDEPLLHLNDRTARERVRVTLGGAQIRIRLTNEYGTSPL